ncbi:dihydropteridine reductase [Psychrobacillus psychrodurans]|uniref:dihydropteridine reductase n=1 Tax=Psychrobacillus psychrodurans TaxID=126157 RepID=UPI0008DFCDFD|nr:dihydropteridine reductase [Psychrobacillus psychrodurans]MCZ8541405.1 dihydropteridine reductase [Psychrobacillus psychrodurans]SFM98036.1 ferredoxin--NADP+ reductase [Psychrobacillus psychrodurans]
MQVYWTKINKIIQESSEVRTYLLDCPQDFTWEEGSHTHFALEGFNTGDKPNRSLIRHMSISTLPHEDAIGITTRIREQCSEFKTILKNLKVGNEVAIFKTHSNVPLKREGKNVYLLSSGVGLATIRPIVLDYLKRSDNVNRLHSLNIDSSKEFLFTEVFQSGPNKKFTSQFVDNRKDYYEKVKNLAADNEGLYYVVGSDEFLVQNIELLREQGIKARQIMLDKHEQQLTEFLSFDL